MKRCAKLDSAEDLQAFVELRHMSWNMPLDQQAQILHDSLNKAIRKNKGKILFTLCAIEMLLRHGKVGLLEELLNPENVQQLEEYFQTGRQCPTVEILQLLAKYVRVGSPFEFVLLPT